MASPRPTGSDSVQRSDGGPGRFLSRQEATNTYATLDGTGRLSIGGSSPAVPAQSLSRYGMGARISVGKTRGFDFYIGDYASADLAVQAALNTFATGYTGGGGWIEMGPGTFDFVNGVTIPAGVHNVRISGAGMATQIRWKNGNTFADTTANTNFLFTTGDYCLIDNLQLQGFASFACPINGVNTFNPGSGTNTIGGGIRVTGGRVWLKDLYVTSMAEDAIRNDGGIGAKYSQLEIIGCGGAGITLSTVQSGSVYATDNDMQSVWIGSCGKGVVANEGGLWISGAHIWGCQGNAVDALSDCVRIIGCYLETNGGWAVNIAANRCLVVGNDLWANGLATTSTAGAMGGVQISGGRFNTVSDNLFRDNRYHAVAVTSSAFENTVTGNVGTNSYGFNPSTGATTTLTAGGAQSTSTTFIDSNAPAWMASPSTAVGVSMTIVGAGNAGGNFTGLVVGWVSSTQVTLESAMLTAATNPTYSVHTMKYGYRELTSNATGNTVIGNNFRQSQTAAVSTVTATSGRSTASMGNLGADSLAWFEAGNISGTISISASTGARFHATLTGNVTTVNTGSTSTNTPIGAELHVVMTQDATGSRTVSGWSSTFKFDSGKGTPTWPATASTNGSMRFVWNGSSWVELGRSF